MKYSTSYNDSIYAPPMRADPFIQEMNRPRGKGVPLGIVGGAYNRPIGGGAYQGGGYQEGSSQPPMNGYGDGVSRGMIGGGSNRFPIGGFKGGYSDQPRMMGGYAESDIYGRRPNPISLADPAQSLGQRVPGLDRINGALSGQILNMIEGRDPQMQAMAQKTGATRAAQLGLTGSGFQDRMADLSLYDRQNALRSQGIAAYNQTIPAISGTQTNSPALQQANDTQNNIWASSPDPAAAIAQALNLYQNGLGALNGGQPGMNLQRGQFMGGQNVQSQPSYSPYIDSDSYKKAFG